MTRASWRLARHDQRRQLGSYAALSLMAGGVLLGLVLTSLAEGVANPLMLSGPVIMLPFVCFWPGIPRDHWFLRSPHVRHREAIWCFINSLCLILLAHAPQTTPTVPLVILAILLNIVLIRDGFIGAVLVYTSLQTSRLVTWSFVTFLWSSYPPDAIVKRAMREKRGLTPNEQLVLELHLRDVLLQGYFPPPARVSRTYRARVTAYSALARAELEGVELALYHLRASRERAADVHNIKLKKLREEVAKQHQQEKSHVI